MTHLFDSFDRVRIINLVDRADRRREMTEQMDRIGGIDGRHVAFFAATRPADPGPFETAGVRGCFESHLRALREAREASAATLLLLEDDLDLADDIWVRGSTLLATLGAAPWSLFYGSHQSSAAGRSGLARVTPDEEILTTAWVAFDGAVLPPLITFLEAMLQRARG